MILGLVVLFAVIHINGAALLRSGPSTRKGTFWNENEWINFVAYGFNTSNTAKWISYRLPQSMLCRVQTKRFPCWCEYSNWRLLASFMSFGLFLHHSHVSSLLKMKHSIFSEPALPLYVFSCGAVAPPEGYHNEKDLTKPYPGNIRFIGSLLFSMLQKSYQNTISPFQIAVSTL